MSCATISWHTRHRTWHRKKRRLQALELIFDLQRNANPKENHDRPTAFEYAQKLTKATDFQDLVRIQTEFMQTQLKTLSEQARDLGETTTKGATGTFKGRLS